jgi:hypothetical protein
MVALRQASAEHAGSFVLAVCEHVARLRGRDLDCGQIRPRTGYRASHVADSRVGTVCGLLFLTCTQAVEGGNRERACDAAQPGGLVRLREV